MTLADNVVRLDLRLFNLFAIHCPGPVGTREAHFAEPSEKEDESDAEATEEESEAADVRRQLPVPFSVN